MGRLKTVSYFEKADNCGGDEASSMRDMPCCEDISEEYKVEDLQKVNFDFTSANLSFIAVVTYVLLDVDLLSVSASHDHYLNYKPPLIAQNVPILVQSFLL
ncbi:MAG: hypothetical protein AAFX87_07815 [Bacteroidota bacterium]